MGFIGSIGNTMIESKQTYYKFRDRHAKLTWQFSPLGNYFLFAEQTKHAAIRHSEWPYPRMPDWLRYSSRAAISKYVHACVFPVFNHRCVLSLVLFLKNRTFFILLLNIIVALFLTSKIIQMFFTVLYRFTLPQISNENTCYLAPFLETNNYDLFHLPFVYT